MPARQKLTREELQTVPSFVRKLYFILRGGYSSIGWTESGDSFAVTNQEQFMERVVPRHFNKQKFLSFQRQLNMLGFKQVRPFSKTSREYQHPNLHRDNIRGLLRFGQQCNDSIDQETINDARFSNGCICESNQNYGHEDRTLKNIEASFSKDRQP